MIIVLHVKTEQTYHEMGNNFLILRHLLLNDFYQFAGGVTTYTQTVSPGVTLDEKLPQWLFQEMTWISPLDAERDRTLCLSHLLLCYTILAAAVLLQVKCFLDYLQKTCLSSHPFGKGLAPLCLWLHW